MKHYFANVPRLGNVAISRHAQERLQDSGVTEELLARVLNEGKDTPDGMDVVWREALGIRLVIVLKPTPFRGAKLVTTAFRIEAQR